MVSRDYMDPACEKTHLGVEPLDLHGGEEDVEEADHDDGEVEKVPRVSERKQFKGTVA